MNRYLKPANQDVAPPGGFPAVRWARHMPVKGFRGAIVLGAISGLSLYCMIGRFKENKQESITHMRRAEERGEQWKILMKHFPFEDPEFRVRFMADQAQKYDDCPEWLRDGFIHSTIGNFLDPVNRGNMGGWWYERDWIGKAPANTTEKAAHDAYDEMVVLAKKRLRLREAHIAKLNERDGALPNEAKRISEMEKAKAKNTYYKNYWEK